jgi:hypothetical protein
MRLVDIKRKYEGSFMKTLSIFTFSFLLVLGSCGKNSVKSSGSATNSYNPYGQQNIGATAQQALANYQAWYASSSESSFPSQNLLARTEYRTLTTYNASNCNNQSVNLFGLSLGSINLCFNASSPSNSQQLTRYITLNTGSSKSNNSKLAQVLSVSNATLMNVTQSVSQMAGGSVFRLEYVKQNGQSLVYVVDTGYNSAMNPVVIIDSEARTSETVTNIVPNY